MKTILKKRKPMSKKVIALDYDGVVANTNQLKVDWIKTTLGKDVPAWQTDRSNCVKIIGEDDYNRLSAYVYAEEASKIALPIPNVVESLLKLSQSYTLFIVTARTLTNVEFAKTWLKSKKLYDKFEDVIPSLKETKASIAERLNSSALVDDDIRHLQGLGSYTFAKYHFSHQDSNTYEDKDIISAPDWLTLTEMLEKL